MVSDLSLTSDVPLMKASLQVTQSPDAGVPTVRAFFDEATFTVSYVVSDPRTRFCAV